MGMAKARFPYEHQIELYKDNALVNCNPSSQPLGNVGRFPSFDS